MNTLSSEIAKIIRDKNKTDFTTHVDCGDNVIVISAEKIRLTGRKLTTKEYLHYTGYQGGERWSTPNELLKKDPANYQRFLSACQVRFG